MGGATGSGGIGSVGSGGTVVPCVPPGAPPEPAPLCGPADAPCQVFADEVLPVPSAFRNDAPGLALNEACLPEILFSKAENGYYGYHALKNLMGEWTVLPTPFDFASGALVRHPSGLPLAIPNDGAFGASLWGFFAEGWTLIEKFPGEATHMERSVAQAPNGDLFVGTNDGVGNLLLGRYAEGWTTSNFGMAGGLVPVAISPEGAPQLVSWTPVNGEWILRWIAPPAAPESVFPQGGTSLTSDAQRPVLAVGRADEKNPMGKPHGLTFRVGQDALELVYFTREGNGAWTSFLVEKVSNDKPLIPLGAVTDEAGDVRLFYARTSWVAPATGQIVAVWPTANGFVDKAVVVEGISPTGATFERDGAGRIHVALYSVVAGSSFDVRYMILGI